MKKAYLTIALALVCSPLMSVDFSAMTDKECCSSHKYHNYKRNKYKKNSSKRLAPFAYLTAPFAYITGTGTLSEDNDLQFNTITSDSSDSGVGVEITVSATDSTAIQLPRKGYYRIALYADGSDSFVVEGLASPVAFPQPTNSVVIQTTSCDTVININDATTPTTATQWYAMIEYLGRKPCSLSK